MDMIQIKYVCGCVFRTPSPHQSGADEINATEECPECIEKQSYGLFADPKRDKAVDELNELLATFSKQLKKWQKKHNDLGSKDTEVTESILYKIKTDNF